jgi:hypothetical protein
MGILDKILGGGLGETIATIVGNKMENKAEAEKLTLEIQAAIGARAHELRMAELQSESQAIAGQVEINKAEASSTSLFKGGWRPMVGWVCASGLAYQMVFRPLIEWVSTIYMWVPPPSLELDTLLTLLFGMLGLGAMRTTERLSGKA